MITVKGVVWAVRDYCDKNRVAFLQHPTEYIPFMEHVLTYFKDKKEISFLEIGLLYGANFVTIGNILTFAGHKVKAVGVDLPGVSRYAGEPNIDPVKKIAALCPLFDYKIFIGDSNDKEIVNHKVAPLAPFDLAFIDGDHSVTGVNNDIRNYKPMTHGLMAFHDTAEPTQEVKKHWPNIREGHKYWDFTCEDHYGIGVIETK